jgi:hypothetical protein
MSVFHLSRRDVLFTLPECQGRAMLAWSIESNPMCEIERVSDGYIMQERDSIAAARKPRRKK